MVIFYVFEGYEEYVWLIGEIIFFIMVFINGMYQVWVLYGIGMVGSYFVYVDELVGVDDLVLVQFNVFLNLVFDELQICVYLNEVLSFSVVFYNVFG